MNIVIENAQTLQNIMLSRATGGEENNASYSDLREVFINDIKLKMLIPSFVQTCRSLNQFWQFIKLKSPSYQGRREIIYKEFQPLFEYLESDPRRPLDDSVSSTLQSFDITTIHATWNKALERRTEDPEGAITLARSLLESVCKHILEEYKVDYGESPDLPKLYKQTSETLGIAPSQHLNNTFKKILGGCTSIVEGLGNLRNELGDSHGKGKNKLKPAPRHAELAVNIAGTMATYLVATFRSQDLKSEANHTRD